MFLLDDVGFLGNPHTGSRSLRKAVMAAGGEQKGGHHGMPEHIIRHCREIVCVVRNPFDILASAYWSIERWRPFPEWLKHTIGQRPGLMRELTMFPGDVYSTHIIRFENYQNQLDWVTNDLGLPRLELPHVGKNEGRKNIKLFDDECVRMLEAVYGEELRKYNYTVEGLSDEDLGTVIRPGREPGICSLPVRCSRSHSQRW
jgi:hypothetical protein